MIIKKIEKKFLQLYFFFFVDPRQVLKWCLGSTAVGAQYGSVSALSFNRDCSRLLCGFAKGQVISFSSIWIIPSSYIGCYKLLYPFI